MSLMTVMMVWSSQELRPSQTAVNLGSISTMNLLSFIFQAEKLSWLISVAILSAVNCWLDSLQL